MIPTMVHLSTTDQIMRLDFYHQSVWIGAILSIVKDHPQCASNRPDFKSSPEKGTILSENHLTAVWFPTFSNRRRIGNLGVDPIGRLLLRIHSPYSPYSTISFVAAVLAGVYISVPYSLTKIRAFCLAFTQALVICYMKLSRNNRLSPIFVV